MPTTTTSELWVDYGVTPDFTTRVDITSGVLTSATEMLAGDTTFEATGTPRNIVFDTVDGVYFVVEDYTIAGGAVEFRILEGTIASAENPAVSHSLTTVYDSGTDANHNADVVNGGTFIGGLGINTATHVLYFADS